MNDVTRHPIQTQGVTFTKEAKAHVLACLKKQEKSRGIRLSVKKKGCSGLAYVIDYVASPEAEDIASELTDDYWVYIAKNSYPYLRGVNIDYVKQGLNQKLVFTNPNQTGQCGCGESFTVD